MKYGSVCSGIEAATQAWHPLGWTPAFFSEIEPFPRAVLKHHWPDVPLHGDFTTIQDGQYEPIDLLVGGTPCQSFSIAGLRGGMGDDRGNLALEYLRLADRLRPRWLVWENVPGVFSSLSHVAPDQRPPQIDLDGDDGPQDGEEVVVADQYDTDESHAFACILAGFSELGYGLAYRTLDAQFTRTRQHPWAVPQRRRRVFVVGYLGDWRRAAAVLFEPESLSGHPPPRREAGQGIAGTIAGGARERGGFSHDDIPHVVGALTSAHGPAGHGGSGLATDKGAEAGHILAVAFGGNNTAGPIDVATAVNAHGGPHGRQDFESETFVAHSLLAKHNMSHRPDSDNLVVAHTLKGEGFDASEDGTGRGTPREACPAPTVYSIMPMNSGTDYKAREVAVAQPVMAAGPAGGNQGGDYVVQPLAFDTTQVTSKANRSNPQPGDPCHPLTGEGHPPAIAFALRGRDEGNVPEIHDDGQSVSALRAASGGSTRDMVAFVPQGGGVQTTLGYDPASGTAPTLGVGQTPGIAGSAVRRLTPLECSRLQGMADDFARIPWAGKPAEECPDGPQYKAYGNSMAVNVMAWLGERIQLVESLTPAEFDVL